MRYDKLACFSADNAIHNNIDICNDLGMLETSILSREENTYKSLLDNAMQVQCLSNSYRYLVEK